MLTVCEAIEPSFENRSIKNTISNNHSTAVKNKQNPIWAKQFGTQFHKSGFHLSLYCTVGILRMLFNCVERLKCIDQANLLSFSLLINMFYM